MNSKTKTKISTGNKDLDYILNGGFPSHHLYLLQGNPGAGKTTLGLQFLLSGAAAGESGLYVTLSETTEELLAVAASHGWNLDGIEIHELAPSEEVLKPDSQYTMFQPSELELTETTTAILSKVEELRPSRVVFDSLSEMRLLAQNPLRYRRQILALKQFFVGRGCTVLLLDDRTSAGNDLHLESLAHGVIDLDQLAPEYGAERRRLRVSKLRGSQYRGGYHDFIIRRGGLEVFPRMVANDTVARADGHAEISSAIPELDKLLGGGLERGSSALFMGPAGAGKSTLALHYALEAANRGERAELFIFDEARETLIKRSLSFQDSLGKHLESKLISITQVDPAEISPGQFAAKLRAAAEGTKDHRPASIIIIDSLNGYLTSMPEERSLVIQLHELLSYLGRQKVATIMVMAQHGIIGEMSSSMIDTSYLADTVVLLRFFEAMGEVRQAISVVKKRTGPHERTIREFSIREGKINIGEPLKQFEGVLSGTPPLLWGF